jgi:tetratricopeptide (TPR) repeat protein
MRVAVVVAPPDLPFTGDGPPPSKSSSVAPTALGDALSRGGFRVASVRTSPTLAADFENALAGVGDGDAVLVYIAGSTKLVGDDVLLRLSHAEDGERALPITPFGEALRRRSPSSALFFLDVRHDGAHDDAMLAADHIDAVVRSLDARARGFGVLIGVRSEVASSTAPSMWPFTRFVLRAIDDAAARDDDGVSRISRVYERVREMPELNTFVQSYALIKGSTDFEISAPRPAMTTAPDIAPPPPSSVESQGPSSLGARPHLTPLLLGADEAREREDWDEALDAYKKALMMVGADDAAARATIYADIGEVKLAQARPREAELNFEKALKALPSHKRSLDALVELAINAKDFKRAIEHRKKRAAAMDRDGRIEELAHIATIYEEDLKDPRGAIDQLEMALALRPGDLVLLARLRTLYEAVHRWPKVVDTLAAMCDASPPGPARAGLRFAQADIVLGRLRDETRGIVLLEQAIADSPLHDRALHALASVRTARQEWKELERLYAEVLDASARLGDKERAWDACRKLGIVRRDKLRDGAGALEAFVGALSCKPTDVDTRAMLAELYLAKGDEASAAIEFETIALHAPARASTYSRLYGLHQRAGRRDRAWLAAQALEELGAADVDHQMLLDQYRPDGQIRPSSALDDAAWDTWLRAPGADDVVTGILGAIVPAAVKMRVDELRAEKKIVALDPQRRQLPSSTASVVRSFMWASQVLGVTLPDLYVLDHVPGGIAAAQVGTPSTALGPDVLHGHSAQELSFVVGRHLAYYRPEHYTLVFFPTLADVTALFLAAVKVALPEVPVPVAMGDAIARIRKQLVRHASPQEREWLSAAVAALEARGGRVDLGAWVRSVELTACRAGLLLCGDLTVAARTLRSETRPIADLSAEDRRRDLLAFCASSELAWLREKLGVTARPSTRPPPET